MDVYVTQLNLIYVANVAAWHLKLATIVKNQLLVALQ